MQATDFNYKRKPALISFLPIYLFCFGMAFLLIKFSPAISQQIVKQLVVQLNIERSNFLLNLPYGIILSLAFLFYGIRTGLWNLMSSYEIDSSAIRLITGSLYREENLILISNDYDISFKQNLIEAPLGIGMIILRANDGGKLVIRGVYGVKSVIEALRAGREAPYMGKTHGRNFLQARTR